MDPLADIAERLEIARRRNRELKEEIQRLIDQRAENIDDVFENN